MQDRYAGDTGDFSKFFLLKKLVPDSMRLALNWYRVHLPEKNNDGKHNSYLKEDHKYAAFFESADGELYHKLRQAIIPTRSVEGLERQQLLPVGTLYHSPLLTHHDRIEWFRESCRLFESADFICCDPDNGFEVKSTKQTHLRSVKYIFFDEVKAYLSAGKSVLVYQHINRTSDRHMQMEVRIEQLSRLLDISRRCITVFYFGKGSGRFYFLLMQDQHMPLLIDHIRDIRDHWQSMFSVDFSGCLL
jgi:hypothetical protein